MSEFCNHYQAAALNKVCKKGIAYETFGNKDEIPCWNEKVGGCPLAQYPTAEEIAERNKHIAMLMEGMMNLMERKSDVCYQCGKKVTKLEKIGRCVYAHPCGCRLWQGSIPKEWR